ncbi:MAG: phage tail protein [Chloroflexi bacterium]|nr:phage tail protein [Chloroflexota bacterium]
MSDPFIGEIKMFGGNFAPLGWALCDGQVIAISQNDTLFSLIGTTYGGDGQETFNLPDLRGRLPIHQGTGPGLSTRVIGQSSGQETVTLSLNQIPSHNHVINANTSPAESGTPSGNILAQSVASDCYTEDFFDPLAMHSSMVSQTGGSQPHSNLMPYLCVGFIISLFGIYPTPA